LEVVNWGKKGRVERKREEGGRRWGDEERGVEGEKSGRDSPAL
jgi:hypothetical protein